MIKGRPNRTAPLRLALEPRIVFDAAIGVVTAHESGWAPAESEQSRGPVPGAREFAPMTLAAVDERPTIVPPQNAVAEQFSPTPLAIEMSDPDGDLQVVTLQIDKGTLHVDLAGNAELVGSNDSAVFRIFGTQGDVLQTLSTLVFTPTDSGTATLYASAHDSVDSTVQWISIEVADAPLTSIMPPPSLTIEEDQTFRVAFTVSTHGTGMLTLFLSTSVGSVDPHPPLTGTAEQINAMLAELTYTPPADYVGEVYFLANLYADDAQSETDNASLGVTLNVTQVTDAFDDTIRTSSGSPVTFNVLASDTFRDSGAFLEGPLPVVANGTLTAGAVAGEFTFTPDDGFEGTTTFTYNVRTAQIVSNEMPLEGNVEMATVTIEVNGPPGVTAPESISVIEDGTFTFDGQSPATTLQVVDPNDNADRIELSVSYGILTVDLTGGATISGGQNGGSTLTLNGTQTQINDALLTLAYRPDADYNGTDDRLRMVVADSEGSITEIPSIPITVNVDPDIVEDTQFTGRNTPLVIATSVLLANDTFEGEPEVTLVDDPVNGTVTLLNGVVTFTPALDHSGFASFRYTVLSGGVEESATVTVFVSDGESNGPTVVTGGTSASGREDPAAGISAVLVASDSDGLSDGTVYEVSIAPRNGSSVIDPATGAWRYTPNADFNGTDRFTVTITDDEGDATDQLITVTVSAVTDIADDALATNEDSPVTITAASLLANDSFEGTPVVTSVGNAVNGSVSLSGGNVTFTPAANFSGAASFSYTVTSGGVTEVATVRVNVLPVNDATVVTGDMGDSIQEDAGTATGTLRAADADGVADGSVFSIAAGPTRGTATIDAATGAWAYVPVADYNGTDTFSVRVTDDAGNATVRSITLTVEAVVDISADAFTTKEDTSLTIVAADLLANDTFEGAPVVTSVGNAVNGSVTLVNGAIVFTPAANFSGTASFSYVVTSPVGVTETAVVEVTVLAVDDATSFGGDSTGSGFEDAAQPISGRLVATDPDGLAHGAVFAILTAPSNGTASIDAATGLWRYTPRADFNGTDVFAVRVTDDAGNVSTRAIDVSVVAVADIATDSGITPFGTPISVSAASLLANDSFEGEPVVTAVSGGVNGMVSLVDGTIVFTPTAGFEGSASFTYTVTSPAGVTETATVEVTVLAPVAPPPPPPPAPVETVYLEYVEIAPLASTVSKPIVESGNLVYVQPVIRGEPLPEDPGQLVHFAVKDIEGEAQQMKRTIDEVSQRERASPLFDSFGLSAPVTEFVSPLREAPPPAPAAEQPARPAATGFTEQLRAASLARSVRVEGRHG